MNGDALPKPFGPCRIFFSFGGEFFQELWREISVILSTYSRRRPWSDPRGEFLGAVRASRVYELLGKPGLGTGRMPGIQQPMMRTVACHVPAGKYDVTAYDWEQYLKFAAIEWPSAR